MHTILLVVDYHGHGVYFMFHIPQYSRQDFLTFSQKLNILEAELLCMLLLLVVKCVFTHVQQEVERNQCQFSHCFGATIMTVP